jgi:hypothetical protein
MKNNNGIHFSETVTDRELDRWEAEYEREKEAFCLKKEAMTDEELNYL